MTKKQQEKELIRVFKKSPMLVKVLALVFIVAVLLVGKFVPDTSETMPEVSNELPEVTNELPEVSNELPQAKDEVAESVTALVNSNIYISGFSYLDEVEAHVKASYLQYEADGWKGLVTGQSEGTKAGGTWRNFDQQLPLKNELGQSLTYKEFDVNDKKSNQGRDAQRFVVSNDGMVYYTQDHYDTFTIIIE